MNEKQANKWLKKVTGRKIRLNYWPKNWYVVPNGKWYDQSGNNPYYWVFECINQNNKKERYCIREGFSKDKDGDCWEYEKPPIIQLIEFIKKLVK